VLFELRERAHVPHFSLGSARTRLRREALTCTVRGAWPDELPPCTYRRQSFSRPRSCPPCNRDRPGSPIGIVLGKKARVLGELLLQFGIAQVTEVACVPLLNLIDVQAQLRRLAERFERLVGRLRLAVAIVSVAAPSSSPPLRVDNFPNASLTVFLPIGRRCSPLNRPSGIPLDPRILPHPSCSMLVRRSRRGAAQCRYGDCPPCGPIAESKKNPQSKGPPGLCRTSAYGGGFWW
jgi:hypothetical protein